MEKYRNQLNSIDQKMLDLFLERLAVVENIAKYKKKGNIKVLDKKRESEIIEKGLNKISNQLYKQYYKKFIKIQLKISKDIQKRHRK